MAISTIETTSIAASAVTPAKLSQPLTSGTAVASTSGTSIDFTGIPSWVKRITVMLNGVSLSSTANILVQIGTGGTPTTSGYASTSNLTNQASSTNGASATNGFVIYTGASATSIFSGSMVLMLLNSSTNLWVASHSGKDNTTQCSFGGGDVTLSGVLNIVRIASSSTDTFDAGSINILYE